MDDEWQRSQRVLALLDFDDDRRVKSRALVGQYGGAMSDEKMGSEGRGPDLAGAEIFMRGKEEAEYLLKAVTSFAPARYWIFK